VLTTGGTGRQTLVVNLPGSRGGCRDGIAVLRGILPHAVAQVRGGDHPAGGGAEPGQSEDVTGGSGSAV
jgi:molybdopterin biosynthesis enzyme MoaB